jgi:hypothetical protein
VPIINQSEVKYGVVDILGIFMLSGLCNGDVDCQVDVQGQ